MNERLRKLRKELNKSQEEFGNKLGVTKTAISKLEKGERNITEQMLLSICRVYNVNYFWLRDGAGEMFLDAPETLIDEIVDEYELDDIDRKIIEKYLRLSPEKRKVLKEYFIDVFT